MSKTYPHHKNKGKSKSEKKLYSTTVERIPLNKLFSCDGYTILDLMLNNEFSQFLENPNDTYTFKKNLIEFLHNKYRFYLERRDQNRLDGILSLLKSIRNDIPLSLNSLGLIKQLMKESNKNTENKSIEK